MSLLSFVLRECYECSLFARCSGQVSSLWEIPEIRSCDIRTILINPQLRLLLFIPAVLMGWPSQPLCQGQGEVAHLIEQEERDYVLSWTPPDTPILSYRRIIDVCDRLLAEDGLLASDRQHLLFCRGVAKWCRGDNETALPDLHQAMTMATNEKNRQTVQLYYALVASTHLTDRKAVRKTVLVMADRLARSSQLRERAMAHVLHSHLAIADGQWQEVLEHTDLALRDDPQCEAALADRAFALWRLAQPVRAADTIRRVRGLTVHTDRVVVEHLRMLILIACGKTEEAAAVTRRTAMRFENRAAIWGWICEQERRRNNAVAARLAALRAYDADRTDAVSLVAMASYYLDAGQIEDAKDLFGKIPEADAALFFNDWGLLSLRIGLGDGQALSRAAGHPQRRLHPTELWRAALYLSSHTDDSIRNGREALSIIGQLAMPPTDSQSYPTCRAIQAVAYAECGKWESAATAIHDAIDHASSTRERERLKVLQAAFARRDPYRMDPKKGVDQPLFISFFSNLSVSH